MGKSFQELFNSYMAEKAANPEKKAEEIIEAVNNKEGIDPSKLSVIKEQCEKLDELSADYRELTQAIKDGSTKEEYIAESLEDATKGLSEEQMNKVQSAILKELDQFAQFKSNSSKIEEEIIENMVTQTMKKDVTITK